MPLNEVRMVNNSLVKRNRGLDPLDDEHAEGAIQPVECLFSIAAMSDQLGNQRVVMGGDDVVGVDG